MTKILVIEDEEAVRENILDLLEAEDFEVISAPNGRVGVDLALKGSPDLILCDLMMPEINGFAVLALLREKFNTSAVPFIFLTARSAKADFRQGMELGADDYLTKPFTRAELLSAISTRLQRQAAIIKNPASHADVKAYPREMRIIESTLRRTIDKGHFREFQMYYQPIVDIKSGNMISVESLIRWWSPKLGLVSPAELIPLAESTGLIVPLSDWILETVCKQTRTWLDSGLEAIPGCVNISAAQCAQPNFVEKVANCLSTNNLEPHYLELEFSETTIMQDVNKTIDILQQLKSLGVKITMDDFGTGNSSLIYLKKIPLHTIKIDNYFIYNLPQDGQKLAITKALIQMGQNLNLKVVAEGVETVSELNILRDLRCHAMQGFLFTQPLQSADFEQMLISKQTLHI
ncbi:EAL domain-containing protein [Rivularia sp. PCC 7116]|uniref:EAL domain-containing response regulator n=1 Tax=Rivularia sp. PCC 7116 TaxID=373994 RepID=UPI00029EF52E|nr:EAL domain-containing response regulator [Rivularia sp. PCC 7116]AFY57774.1 EAL domain-containing protein [Rivularia sp. PCC 7116]